jgi:prevent-host-death family protein
MKTVTAAQARNHLGDLLGEVAHAKSEILITRRGKAIAKIVPVTVAPPTQSIDPRAGLVRQADGSYRNPEGIEDDSFFASLDELRAGGRQETPRDPFAAA